MKRLRDAAIFAVACMISLAGMETALRLYGDDVLAMGNQFRFYRFDEELGWSNTPNASGHFARSEYRHFIQINSAGMRDREPLPADGRVRRVAVMGDSFTWGVGADYGERFTEVLEQSLPEVDVLNYGVSGYGTTQHLVQLKTVLAERPDMVVLALCLSNDVSEALEPFRNGYNKPFARRDAAGGVEVVGYPLVNIKAMGDDLVGADSSLRLIILANLIRRKFAAPHPALSDPRFRSSLSIGGELYTPDELLVPKDVARKHEAFNIEAELLSRMNAMTERAIGPGRFLVAFVPTKMESIPEVAPSNERGGEMGDQLRVRLDRMGIAVLDVRDRFGAEHFWRRDGHWNVMGHRLFAASLAERLSPVP